MNVNLFGHRCLVEFTRLKTTSKIVIPDAAQTHDTHRIGIVRFIGDGKVKGKDEPVPSLVKPGDMVMFQMNQVMENTQKYVADGKHYMNLLQTELVCRINGEDMSIDNLEALGDYTILKHFVREASDTIILPDSVARQNANEFIYFKLLKKGSTVDLPINVNDELIVNFGRLTPMFIVTSGLEGTRNEEYCYTSKEWIDAVVFNVDTTR
jgi:co-chaperonin GroES (HSP10)